MFLFCKNGVPIVGISDKLTIFPFPWIYPFRNIEFLFACEINCIVSFCHTTTQFILFNKDFILGKVLFLFIIEIILSVKKVICFIEFVDNISFAFNLFILSSKITNFKLLLIYLKDVDDKYSRKSLISEYIEKKTFYLKIILFK